ncbi:hypothetical protein [Candidatus Palauibacter sp.]|uniref:hypothetical protein n=1 Tax=Candidatus Palauibacter sp. TaxID=3101350 RepID=UPI003AF2CA05
MSHLAARRFPDTVTRRRRGEPSRNEHGEYVPGQVTETALRASVQPLSLEDADMQGGVQVSHRLNCYVPGAGELQAAVGDDAPADRVIVDGEEFVVETSQSWRGSHTRAVLLREP